MMRCLSDVLGLMDEMTSYLRLRGMRFTKDGFPILSRKHFLDRPPKTIVPYDFRNTRCVENPSETVLCFFCADTRIYPRLEKMLLELEEYRRFMGVVASDVTVTSDMDPEWQTAIMQLNQLHMAVLAVNGIKVVANLRRGSPETLAHLKHIPCNAMWATGFLGCADGLPQDMDFIKAVLAVSPSMLLIYGRRDPNAMEKLDAMGVRYKVYPDYHKLSRQRTQTERRSR